MRNVLKLAVSGFFVGWLVLFVAAPVGAVPVIFSSSSGSLSASARFDIVGGNPRRLLGLLEGIRAGPPSKAKSYHPWPPFMAAHGGAFARVVIGGLDLLEASQGFDLDAIGVSPIPEPSTLLLLGAGLAGLGLWGRKRRIIAVPFIIEHLSTDTLTLRRVP